MTAPKLKPSMRISGGNPAGMPDFKPLNPWGREMPKLTRAMPSEREGKAPEVDLYSLWVTTKSGRDIRIGPKAVKEFHEPMIVAINKAIIEGKEKNWREPRLLPAEPSLAVQ